MSGGKEVELRGLDVDIVAVAGKYGPGWSVDVAYFGTYDEVFRWCETIGGLDVSVFLDVEMAFALFAATKLLERVEKDTFYRAWVEDIYVYYPLVVVRVKTKRIDMGDIDGLIDGLGLFVVNVDFEKQEVVLKVRNEFVRKALALLRASAEKK